MRVILVVGCLLAVWGCSQGAPLTLNSQGMAPSAPLARTPGHRSIIVHVTGDSGATPYVNGAEVDWDGQFVGTTDATGIVSIQNEAYGKSHDLWVYHGEYGMVREVVKLTAGVRDVTVDLGPRLR